MTERSLYAVEGPAGRVFPRFQFAAKLSVRDRLLTGHPVAPVTVLASEL